MDVVTNDKDTAQYEQQIKELTGSLQKYSKLVKISNTGTWEYNLDTGFLDCNPVYFTMLGRDVNNYDLSGNKNLDETWVELLHPDDRNDAIKKFADYLEDPSTMYESFFRLKHADGNWVWICSRGGFLKDENGKRTNIVLGTHVEISKQKQAEEEIQRERILLRTLIDNLPDIIFVKDSQGRKVIANKADVRNLGAGSESDVIGKTDIELFPDEEIGRRGYENDMELLRTGNPILNKEEVFYDKNGVQYWLLTTKVPVYDEAGQISRILGIGHNITERKKSDEALKKLNSELNVQSQELSEQAEELKALNEQLIKQQEQELEKAIAQGKFEIASEVLHDIGNALVGFGSYLTRINRCVEKNTPDAFTNLNAFLTAKQTAIAGAIGVDKAAALVSITANIAKAQAENQTEVSTYITELLNIVSHIQEILNIQRQFVRGHNAGQERKPVNLEAIIDDCRSMLFASMDKKGVKFHLDVEPGKYIIKGDQTKLMQVLLNVLKNSLEAIDFEKEEKTITVSLSSTRDAIGLKITDNGHGFAEETGAHLFERGYTTKKSGTGLGLYSCRSIVEAHAGTFDISSEGAGLGAVTLIRFSASL